MLITHAASLLTRSPKLTGMLQQRWHLFASGGTHSFLSTAFQRISFPSSLPTFPPKRTVSIPLLCRHWRGILLRHGALWSQLFLGKGEECISTLLERAKGSALDVITSRNAPVGTISLISPRAQQIMNLEFMGNYWQDIMAFSELNSGQLPLLRALGIVSPEAFDPHHQPVVVTPSSIPLFRGSINLQYLVLCLQKLSSLSHFLFPNLTTFKLFSTTAEECSATSLLDFLKASPQLQTVEMTISAKIVLESIPQETVVILPDVKTFSLHVIVANGTVPQVYDIAAHVSCPCAKYTSLMQDMYDDEMNADLEVFPTPGSWNTIIRQYAASPVEEVIFEIKPSAGVRIACFLTFRSSDETVVIVGLRIYETDADKGDLNMSLVEMGRKIFSKALVTIRNHPLLSHVKRPHINQRAAMSKTRQMGIANEVWGLFTSLGPLDELSIRGCDLHIPLANFIETQGLYRSGYHTIFPRIKELRILYPSTEGDEMECVNMIVALAKIQHGLEIPFKCVTVRTWDLHAGIVEELRRWVAAVDYNVWCREEGEDM